MTSSTYNVIAIGLAIAALVALLVMVASLVFMITKWRTSSRRGNAIRALISLAVILACFGTQQAILWWVFLPALGREKMAELNASRAKRVEATTFVKVGETMPGFSLTTIDGETVVLPMLGKVVLVNFFATWCGPCQMELPHIERIWSDFKQDDRFRLVVIGREETAETVREFRQKRGFTFPIAADPERSVYSLIATESIPRTLIVSAEGRVVYSNLGFYETDVEEIRAELRKQLGTLR